MTIISFSNAAGRNVFFERSLVRPVRMFACCATKMGWVLVICLLASLLCRADVKAPSKNGGPPTPRRSWAEVKVEIDEAFDVCWKTNAKVRERPTIDSPSIGGGGDGSIRPDKSVLEMVFDRHPSGRPQEAVIILDIRVERDYSNELGQGSSFRIVRNIAKDEGLLMLNEMVSFFEKKKWPYEIIDPKKKEKPGGKNAIEDLEKKSSP